MKSFKKFLMEELSSSAADLGSAAQPSTPTTPKGTQPTTAQVELPVSDDERDRTPPDPIDWGELDDRIRDMTDQFESILRMMGILSWDAFVQWLWANHGIDLSGVNSTGIWSTLRKWYMKELETWFGNNYPNPTSNQQSTFQHHLFNLDDRLQELWELHDSPSTPGSTNPFQPFGGADDDRYRPMDLNNPDTWENFDPYDPFRSPWWARPPRNEDDPRNPYPGVYQS
ncbi:MAG: hypothetical protein ACOYNN_17270 [Terrimicrobiaceae bacterium]